MGCAGCSTGTNGESKGCQNNGTCGTGGCNRLNTFDWLSKMDIYDPSAFHFVEVSFKNGARKAFFKNDPATDAQTGDMAIVDLGMGFDVGQISLSGDLVRLQMNKKKVTPENVLYSVIRRANNRDLEKLTLARKAEKNSLIRARAVARTLGLDMKIGDVEFRGDNRKATFYYTAEGRVDFRELVRAFAKEFRVKIEMRQIGARQESARIGGLGSCGRELCCSTWLTDFKSVSTTAARYQNISINQSKLSGQCGRLKCCLNYELDTYMDALKEFPKRADRLEAESGRATLIKTDIFKRLMYYSIQKERGRGLVVALDVDRVKEILALNKNGKKPVEFSRPQTQEQLDAIEKEAEMDFADVTGQIELPYERRKSRRKNQRRNPRGNRKPQQGKGGQNQRKTSGQDQKGQAPKGQNPRGQKPKGQAPKSDGQKPTGQSGNAKNRRNKRRPPNKPKTPPSNN